MIWCLVFFFFFSAFHTIFGPWSSVLAICSFQSVLLLSPQVQSFSKLGLGKLSNFLKDQIKLIKLDTIAKSLD